MRVPTRMVWLLLSVFSGSAFGHAALVDPKPRTDNAGIKAPAPCGNPNLYPSGISGRKAFKPGQTITVTFTETINHYGFYRLSFSAGSDANWIVLKDNIPNPQPAGGAPDPVNTTDITLPNMECTDCTLQLIQVMTANVDGSGAQTFYYSCSDITLSEQAPVTPGPDAGTPTETPDAGSVDSPVGEVAQPLPITGGCTSGPGSSVVVLTAALFIFAFFFTRRRPVRAMRHAPTERSGGR